jgi:ferric iron reductase protein FhuF
MNVITAAETNLFFIDIYIKLVIDYPTVTTRPALHTADEHIAVMLHQPGRIKCFYFPFILHTGVRTRKTL